MRQVGLGRGGEARAAMPFSKPRRFTPPTGPMSEQLDRTSSEQS
jgi:hypothetical protein